MVTNPEVSSVRDSDRILGILASKSRRAERGEEPVKRASADHPLRHRAGRSRARCSRSRTCSRCWRCRCSASSRNRDSVLKASNTGTPVILDEESAAGKAYRDAVARFMGEQLEYRIVGDQPRGCSTACSSSLVAEERVSILHRTLGARGAWLLDLFRPPAPATADDRQGAVAGRPGARAQRQLRRRASCRSSRRSCSR